MVFLPILVVQINDAVALPVYTNFPLQVLGFLSIIAGSMLLLTSVLFFARYGRGGSPLPFDPPNQLVSKGPFRYSRNPMFVASAMIWLGEFLLTGALLMLLYALAWIIFNHIHLIVNDEKWLEQRFGNTYQTYKRKTPRYLPKLV